MAVDKEKQLPAGITKRPDGLYMARFQYEGIRYTLYDKDLEMLKNRMEDQKYELRHGIYQKEQNITVDDWFHTWIEEYKMNNVKPTTLELYERTYIHHIYPYLKKRKLKDIRPEHIQRVFNQEAKKLSKQSLQRLHVIINSMFKQAYKNGIIKRNPVSMTTLPKGKEADERRVMSKEEQEIFLKYTREVYYGDIFEVALSTGMRSGELRGLQWSDVDFDNRVIHITGTLVYTSKTGHYKSTPKTRTSRRDIPMLDNVYKILKKRKKEQLEMKMMLGAEWNPIKKVPDLVFTKANGNLIEQSILMKYLNHIVDLIHRDGIEFEHIMPHTLRHTFATRCIENGMPPQVLKTILGHTSLAMTMDLYSHVLPDTKAQEIQKIAGLF